MDRLSNNLSSRSIEGSVSSNSSSLSLSGLNRMINNSILTSVNLYSFGSSVNSRLYISLSNSQLSWNININISGGWLVINDRFLVNSLCIYRSFYNFSSNYRSLNNSLSNNRLFDNSLSNNWLTDNFSGDNRSTLNSLSRGNYRFAEKNLSIYKFRFTHRSGYFSLLNLLQLS